MRLCSKLMAMGILASFIGGAFAGEETAVKKYDMGHPKSPVWANFTPVSVNSQYSPESHYGWIHNGSKGEKSENFVNRISKTSKPNPDSLIGDYVFWRGGEIPLKFKVDLPDGDYHVWLYMGGFLDAGAFYDHASFFVSANGKKVVERNTTKKSFRKKIFREFDDSFEWKPGDSVWDKYIKDSAGKMYEFPVHVKNGSLVLAFHMEPNGGTFKDNRINAVLPINAIVICPDSELAKGRKLIAEIDRDRKKEFEKTCKLKMPTGKNKLSEKVLKEYSQKGYVPFIRTFMKKIYPNTEPAENEIKKSISIGCAQGQREIISFGIYPIRTLEKADVSVSPLKGPGGAVIPSKDVEVYRLRYIEQSVNYQRKTNDYRPEGKLMMPARPMDIQKGVTRQFIIAVTPPEKAAPGKYRGEIEIKASNAPATKIALETTVYPFKLETYPDDDERIWIYYPMPFYRRYGALLMDEKEQWKRIDKDLAFMKKYHIAPTVLFSWFTPEDDLEKFMELYKKYGFRGHPAYGGYELLGALERQQKKGIPADYAPFAKRIKELEAKAKEKGWPKFAYYTTAEIHTGMPGYLEGKKALNILKKEAPDAILFCLPNKMEELEVMLESPADIIGPNAISMTDEGSEMVRESGKKLWFYGWGRERFRCGLVDWRLRNRGGLKEWYSYVAQAPFNPFDGKNSDSWNDSPPYIGPDGPIPTPGLEETTAGRIDFEYLATLELWLQRAEKVKSDAAAKAVKNAKALIKELEGRIEPDYYYYYKRKKEMSKLSGGDRSNLPKEKIFKWKFSEYADLRKKIAACIIELKNACEKKG